MSVFDICLNIHYGVFTKGIEY